MMMNLKNNLSPLLIRSMKPTVINYRKSESGRFSHADVTVSNKLIGCQSDPEIECLPGCIKLKIKIFSTNCS